MLHTAGDAWTSPPGHFQLLLLIQAFRWLILLSKVDRGLVRGALCPLPAQHGQWCCKLGLTPIMSCSGLSLLSSCNSTTKVIYLANIY